MVQAYKNYWMNFFNFGERTSRSGYWYVVLMNFIISFLLGIVLGIIFGGSSVELDFTSTESLTKSIEAITNSPANLISSIWSLVNLIPGLAIGIRRLHDTNKSGLWYLTLLIPIAGFFFAIALIIFFCLPSVNEGNKYGSKQV